MGPAGSGLEELRQDGRMSFAELGRSRRSEPFPAVAERVRKMEDAGIIGGFRAEG